MCISPSSTIIISCYYVLMIVFITSSYAYVIDSDDLKNSLPDQQYALNLPSAYDRYIRTTKFPRIGRSASDLEEISSIYETNPTENEEINNEDDYRWMEQRSVLFPRIGKRSVLFPRIGKRSVLFPRIGKRAFHNILGGNSYSNPHRMLALQGPYHTNGYDYHIHQSKPQSMFHYRGKRDLSM
ncbi:unnamed protein product [Adineta steineri]|uniref:Uncharacterized protein n=1 Tax=Adineta steineri TaxID=433720 RepID=A0A818JGZ9_9BILA|nr:unnamed protein product [Adineta steineri]CAF3541781.1 unnamed protein product [Adineta steineri]